jgi:hypothetical protein
MSHVNQANDILGRVLSSNPRKHSIAWALGSRLDLVNSETAVIAERNSSHRERWATLEGTNYGTSGGSASERRLIAEGLAALERAGELEGWLALTREGRRVPALR